MSRKKRTHKVSVGCGACGGTGFLYVAENKVERCTCRKLVPIRKGPEKDKEKQDGKMAATGE